jgi:phosphoribosylanthranilate isomerase
MPNGGAFGTWPLPEAGGSRPLVKICGITRAEDGLVALRSGADFLGLIFASSPRQLDRSKAKGLLEDVRREFPKVRAIGVFVNEPMESVRSHVTGLGLFAAQLHGDYSLERVGSADFPVLRAFSVKGREDDEEIRNFQAISPILLDAFASGKHGGTGSVFDHRLALPAIARGNVFVAGGLNPQNIADVLEGFRREHTLPYALDASSGLEDQPGRKSAAKVAQFLSAIQAFKRSLEL